MTKGGSKERKTQFQEGESGNMEGKLKICFGRGKKKGRKDTRDRPRNEKHNEDYEEAIKLNWEKTHSKEKGTFFCRKCDSNNC